MLCLHALDLETHVSRRMVGKLEESQTVLSLCFTQAGIEFLSPEGKPLASSSYPDQRMSFSI